MTIAHFDGETYDPGRDHGRLGAQMMAVYSYMRDGHWDTLNNISHAIYAPEASISARLRDLRKAKFGGHAVERRYVGCGLHEYRLVVRQ